MSVEFLIQIIKHPWRRKEELLDYAKKLMNNESLMEEEFNEKVGAKFDEMVNASYDAFEVGLTADSVLKNGEINNLWTYPLAVLFSTTVITTVGYGHIVPRTFWGRLVCIIYALMGVPLALITIADIAKFVGQMFLTVYQNYRKMKKDFQEKRRNKKHLKRLQQQLNKRNPQSMSVKRKVKVVPVRSQEKKQRDSSVDLIENKEEQLKEEIEAALGVQMPPSLVLLVLLTYITTCAVIFTYWEGWSFLNAFYFSFITLVTVGFGDLVPSPNHGAYLFLAIFLIVSGLVLTTMSIDLVGTHYIRKIHYMGRRLEDAQQILKALGLKRKKKWRYKNLIKIPIMSDGMINFFGAQTGYTQAGVLAFSFHPVGLFGDIGYVEETTVEEEIDELKKEMEATKRMIMEIKQMTSFDVNRTFSLEF